jgi:hypothetical protein
MTNKIYTSDIVTAMEPQPVYYPPLRPLTEQRYLHTAEAGAFVPLLQSAVTGVLFGLIALTILIWQNVADWPVYSILIWLGSTAFTWLSLQRHWLTLTSLERATGIDINQDGVIGDVVESPSHVVRVDLRATTPDGNYQATRTILPIDENALCILADGLLSGKSLSEREWTGYDRPLSVSTFRDLRQVLIERKWIEQVNSKDTRQGYRLTRPGKAVMKHFAAMYSPALPVDSEFVQ